jgi:hypothetical protein
VIQISALRGSTFKQADGRSESKTTLPRPLKGTRATARVDGFEWHKHEDTLLCKFHSCPSPSEGCQVVKSFHYAVYRSDEFEGAMISRLRNNHLIALRHLSERPLRASSLWIPVGNGCILLYNFVRTLHRSCMYVEGTGGVQPFVTRSMSARRYYKNTNVSITIYIIKLLIQCWYKRHQGLFVQGMPARGRHIL